MKKLAIHRARRNSLSLNNAHPQSNLSNYGNKLDFGWTALVSLIVTVFTALAFGSGQAYRSAYLIAFNFDPWLIPWSFQDTVYQGIAKQIHVILIAPIYAWIILSVIIVIYIWFIKMSSRLTKRKYGKSGFKQKNNSEFEGNKFMESFFTLLSYFILFGFIVMLMGTYFLVNAEHLGKQDAENDIAAILDPTNPANEKSKKELRFVEIKRLIGKMNVIEKGYIIDCNEHICGLYRPSLKERASQIVHLDNVISFNIHK